MSNLGTKHEYRNPAGNENVAGQSEAASGCANKLDVASVRLLDHLAGEGASALANEFGKPGGLDVFAMRNGVTLRVAGSTMVAAANLVQHDLACWNTRGASGRKYLEISDTGRSQLRRKTSITSDKGFIAQHKTLNRMQVEVNGMGADVVVDASESPLAWLARRKGQDGRPMIDVVQLEAGERFRRDLEQAQMLPRVTANWEGGGVNTSRGEAHLHIGDMMIAARQRVNLAIEAVGSDCAGILVDVCGFLKGLGTVEFERQWPRRSAKVVLGVALSALARHCGLAHEARGPRASTGLQHWGSNDFRPLIHEPAGRTP